MTFYSRDIHIRETHRGADTERERAELAEFIMDASIGNEHFERVAHCPVVEQAVVFQLHCLSCTDQRNLSMAFKQARFVLCDPTEGCFCG